MLDYSDFIVDYIRDEGRLSQRHFPDWEIGFPPDDHYFDHFDSFLKKGLPRVRTKGFSPEEP